ncbi:MAG: hypothetical protein IJ391_05095 [Clostridia bacterium]|nr:hypothetical protein [Clostridia bacterium]
MKNHVLVLGTLAIIFGMISGTVRKNEIVGSWRSDSSIVSFESSGRCIIDGECAGYRLQGDGNLCLSRAGRAEIYPYMISFDGESMYFNGKRYVKTAQSGLERSIIEFLL